MPGVKYILYPLSSLKNDSTESVTVQYLRKKYFITGIEQSYGSFFSHPVAWPDVRSCHSPVRGGHPLQKHWRSVR